MTTVYFNFSRGLPVLIYMISFVTETASGQRIYIIIRSVDCYKHRSRVVTVVLLTVTVV